MTTTKSKKKNRLVVTSAVLLAIMLTASACGDGNNKTPNNTNPGAPLEQPGDAVETPGNNNLGEDGNNANSGVTEPDNAAPDSTDKDKPNGNDDAAVKTAEGTYSGMMDTHSIEVITSDGPMALQFTDELSDTLNKLEPDSKIKFEYTEKKIDADVTQFWLKKLDKIE